MYGCGNCGCGHSHCHDWDEGPRFGRGPGWGYARRFAAERETKDEMIEDLEEYKENLEAEIRKLEKRIGSLREKPASE